MSDGQFAQLNTARSAAKTTQKQINLLFSHLIQKSYIN